MKRSALVLWAATLLALVAVAAACGGDSDGGLSVLSEGGASPTATSSPAASASPSPTTSPSATGSSSPSASPDGGDSGPVGELSADEFTAYLDAVRPWYDRIIALEAEMINIIAEVEENQISPGQGARRLERLGWKLDPPVTELAGMDVPIALDDAHIAWIDGISLEARAFARLVELMSSGTYQRGTVDPEYEQLFTQASAKWDKWREVLGKYEAATGVEAPWLWYGE